MNDRRRDIIKTVYAKDYLILPDEEAGRSDTPETVRPDGQQKEHRQPLTRRIQEMVKEHPKDTRFVFEPGTYHFEEAYAVKRSVPVSNSDPAEVRAFGIFLEGLENAVLDGQGACFCFHGDMTPLAVLGCRHVSIMDLTITSAVPRGAEARILRAAEEAVEIEIDPVKFPHCIEDEQLYFLMGEELQPAAQKERMFAAMEFDADTNRVRSGAGDTFPPVKAYETGKNTVRLDGCFRVVPKPGNLLVLRHGKRVHPGILIQNSEDVLIENMTIHQTAGLGIVFQFNRDLCIRNVEFSADHTKGCQIISGHDDGLHFSNNSGQITIEDCRFRGLMDDPVNIHGTSAGIRKITDRRKLRGVYRHPQSVGFERWAAAVTRSHFFVRTTEVRQEQRKPSHTV